MNRRDFLTRAVFSGDRRLLPHQVEQAIFAVERERSLNASETGTGKFLVALAMRRLVEHEAGAIVKYFYTCPKSALGQFESEFIDHNYRTFVLRHGNDIIPADADTVLVASSTLLVTHRDQLRSWHPLLVVLDEAAAFKTANAARTKAVYGDALDGIGGIIEGVRLVLAMSGTLAPGHNGELYPHLRALAPVALPALCRRCGDVPPRWRQPGTNADASLQHIPHDWRPLGGAAQQTGHCGRAHSRRHIGGKGRWRDAGKGAAAAGLARRAINGLRSRQDDTPD